MSLPLPVFRLDARSELPFEPLCAITAIEPEPAPTPAGGMLERFRLWLLRAGRAPDRQPGVG